MIIQPLGNRILVEEVPFDTGKIITTATAPDEPMLCFWRVLALGTGRMLADGSVKPIDNLQIGDEVNVHMGGMCPLRPAWAYQGKHLAICDADAVMSIITRAPGEKVMQPATNKILKAISTVPTGLKQKTP